MAPFKASLETIRDEHRAWLGKHGLLDRPWFVLGSAPEPTIPTDIADRAALVCINNAAATAARLGLPPPSLTFRNPAKEWNSVAGIKLPLVLWVSNKSPWGIFWAKLFFAKARVGEIRAMSKNDRTALFTHVLGTDLSGVGQLHKPSTGIFAALYGLFMGAPEIVLAGLSMERDGYSYGSLPGIQKHREEDRLALRILAERYPQVSTTERDVSEQTGVPLFSSVAAAASGANGF